MAGSALGTVLEMIVLVLQNTVSTLVSVFGLFIKFIQQLGPVGIYGGTAGIILAMAVFGLVAYFLAKFFFRSGKAIIMLLVIGIILFIILVFSAF